MGGAVLIFTFFCTMMISRRTVKDLSPPVSLVVSIFQLRIGVRSCPLLNGGFIMGSLFEISWLHLGKSFEWKARSHTRSNWSVGADKALFHLS